ncbi:hypothetical protein [Zunongwangia profunda]|uniref:Fibronectin type-III domain-containing protein n=1 Tax=Zunongwangia profunda (strain DSM 18752 / CCTCC AB 206139 / SM-A87) TaxID=655815 RepID=D5BKG6_ZUNPS|nr:hypothetical protein [Zunongwangia profunda]ADF53878.1 conserved hypothetical protein [Zunongwangia profunda SM-A87]MAS72038.1 hypothetical protein [Zunongwangia sp.]|tara:strand:+ start:4881 stop:5573 length:693 start_codon:yes stop_codon:yes gene_type:complete
MRKLLIFILSIFCLFSCSPENSSNEDPNIPSNQAPTAPQLIYPDDNSLCINQDIEFSWNEVNDPDGDKVKYIIEISNNRSFSDIFKTESTTSLSININFPKGQAYYWRLYSMDIMDNKSTYSNAYAFYVEGEAANNHIPFKAKLIAPGNNSNAISGTTILLNWESSDIDDDTLTYDIYFGTDGNLNLIKKDLEQNNLEVDIETNKKYYWIVNCSDGKSTSLGDRWTFSTK